MSNTNGSKWIRKGKRQAIYARDDHRCVYCGADLTGKCATLDHVTPRELGGGNEASNLVTACLSCNSRKQDLPLRKFLATIPNGTDVARRIRNATRRQLSR